MKEYINYTLLPNNSIKDFKVKKNLIDEKSKLVPSEIGFEINKYMEKNFKNIIDSNFTSDIEESLDKIAEGNKTLISTMNPFYKDFSKYVNAAKGSNKTNVENGKSKIKLETYTQDFKIKNNMYTLLLNMVLLFNMMILLIKIKRNLNISTLFKSNYKTIEDIDKKDIKLLLSLPKVIGQYKNKNVELLYARYGFYLKNDNKNASIFKQYLNLVLNGSYEDIIKLIKDKD